MNYYQRLRDLREDNGKSQSEIAEILNTSRSYYSQYERGAKPITLERVIKLAKYYDVSIDYIVGLTNKKHSYKEWE